MTLPRDVSLDLLYSTLNDPRRHRTPRATVEAIVWAVRDRGIPALDEPANAERLARCDSSARLQIKQRLIRLGLTRDAA